MKISEVATARRWRVENQGRSGGTIEIAGWDFGGEGELALLQHANGMCGALWALVATQLTTNYRVIALDCRGHGDSEMLTVPDDYDWPVMVADIAQVADSLTQEFGVDQIALALGSSFGGILLAGTAAKYPNLFKRLVMLDPPIHPTDELIEQMGVNFQAPPSSREGLVEQTLKRKYIWDSRESARQAWQDKPLFSVWDARAFDIYLNAGMKDREDGQVELKCHPTVEAHIFASTGSFGLFDYAPHVQIPVELVHAEQGFFSAEFYGYVSNVFPQCRLSSMPAGHLLPLEAPDVVANFVLGLT